MVSHQGSISFGLLALAFTLTAQAAEEGEPSKFRDPDDGKFDVSAYLDTAYGFLPVLAPITEPAVGACTCASGSQV